MGIKNKRGVVAFYLFMLGVVFFVLGMALAPVLTDSMGEVQDNLDCDNVSISNQNKILCYQVDSISPLFIGVIFGFAGIILGRILM